MPARVEIASNNVCTCIQMALLLRYNARVSLFSYMHELGREEMKNQIIILKNRCRGCGYCVWFCPNECLVIGKERNELRERIISVNPNSKCSGCKMCEEICPAFAIFVKKKKPVYARLIQQL